MKNQERKRLHRIYGQLYRRTKNFNLIECAYCQYPRQCLDHVPPLTALPSLNVREYIKAGGKLILYPSCLQCNKYLSSRNIIDFYERLDYLSHKYSKKIDTIEVWEKHELAEMGPLMTSYIKSHQHEVREYIHKLQNIENRMTDLLLSDEDSYDLDEDEIPI